MDVLQISQLTKKLQILLNTTNRSIYGVKTVELPTGDGGKETLITTVTFEAGKPVDVNIDVKGEDGTMKSQLVKDGKYVIANETAPWTDQVDSLEKFIVENNIDLSKITLTEDEGKTDAVSSVTIKLGEYVESVQKSIRSYNMKCYKNNKFRPENL